MEFKYLKANCGTYYPIGTEYPDTSYHYVREVTRVINETFPEGNIILLVRGTSGTILAGGVAYLLARKGRNVTISVSRKSEEKSHSSTYSNISKYTKGIFIVLDDFICSGETVECILGDFLRLKKCKLDMLCVCNKWNQDSINDESVLKRITQNFKYVCCNKLEKD